MRPAGIAIVRRAGFRRRHGAHAAAPGSSRPAVGGRYRRTQTPVERAGGQSMSDFLYQILNHDWFTFAVECVAMASACAARLAAVVLAIRLAAGRWLAPRYRHALWLLVALRLFLPVAPESRFSLHRLWLDALTAYTDS